MPEGDYLPKPRLEEIKLGLVDAMLRNLGAFHDYMSDDDAISPHYQQMYSPLVEQRGDEYEGMCLTLSRMTPRQFDSLLGRLRTRLLKETKLYYDIRHDYTLVLPRQYLAAAAKDAAPLDEELQCYNFMLKLFQHTLLTRGTTGLDAMVNSGVPEPRDLPDGNQYSSQWFQFPSENQCVAFINRMLPPGKRFTPQSELQRLN